MRQLFACLALLLSLVFQSAAWPDEVAIPPLTQRVTDLAGMLDANQRSALESRLAQREMAKGSQIAILTVPSTQPEAIEQFAIRVVDQWKLGRKGVDDGLLILIARDDRKMRIEVGYGLEGVIPDAVAKRVVSEVMAPHFKQGDYFGGLSASLDKLFGLLDGETLPPPAQQQASDNDIEGLLPLLLFGGIIVGALLRSIFGSFLGGAINGGLIGALVWILGGGLVFALVLGIVAFVVTLLGVLNGVPNVGGYPGGYSGGGSGGFGGGFSGGGGGFGGGGASGDW